MDAPVRIVRVSVDARDQLIRLKRYTGITQWNILCRWALCRSLAEPTPPSPAPLPAMSNVEMSWSVFAGPYSALFILLLKQRCLEEKRGVDEATLADQLRLHLHRGIATLATRETRAVEDVVRLGVGESA